MISDSVVVSIMSNKKIKWRKDYNFKRKCDKCIQSYKAEEQDTQNTLMFKMWTWGFYHLKTDLLWKEYFKPQVFALKR